MIQLAVASIKLFIFKIMTDDNISSVTATHHTRGGGENTSRRYQPHHGQWRLHQVRDVRPTNNDHHTVSLSVVLV